MDSGHCCLDRSSPSPSRAGPGPTWTPGWLTPASPCPSSSWKWGYRQHSRGRGGGRTRASGRSLGAARRQGASPPTDQWEGVLSQPIRGQYLPAGRAGRQCSHGAPPRGWAWTHWRWSRSCQSRTGQQSPRSRSPGSRVIITSCVCVTHVVYPLSSFVPDKALVLTRIPVIPSGVNRVSTIDATEHPPVTCQQVSSMVFLSSKRRLKFHLQCPPWCGHSEGRHCRCRHRARPQGTAADSRCPACSPSSPQTPCSRSRGSSRRGRRRPPPFPRCQCCPAYTRLHSPLSSDTDSWSCTWKEKRGDFNKYHFLFRETVKERRGDVNNFDWKVWFYQKISPAERSSAVGRQTRVGVPEWLPPGHHHHLAQHLPGGQHGLQHYHAQNQGNIGEPRLAAAHCDTMISMKLKQNRSETWIFISRITLFPLNIIFLTLPQSV